jgi:hypothetical protein
MTNLDALSLADMNNHSSGKGVTQVTIFGSHPYDSAQYLPHPSCDTLHPHYSPMDHAILLVVHLDEFTKTT